PAILLRIGLLFFAIGVTDAVAGGEAPPLGVPPFVADAGVHDVAVQNAGIVVAVPARARVPEEFRADVAFVASANEVGGDIQGRLRLDQRRRRVRRRASDGGFETGGDAVEAGRRGARSHDGGIGGEAGILP